ncbi:hypothetical protein [uncultured Winogradskyella sp.]|uniref:hypothetical protein n=1 Tax=uncultured Winogradskyella sp. TaxID=395353 RepID=UPI002601FE36|nr:hypothetical protein [uncultured Winogradskyella sp.]
MNLKYKFYIIIISFLTVFACSNDDDGGSSNKTAIDIVTGINARQDNLSAGFRLGNPNVRMPLNISSVSVIAFPNPVRDFLSIQISQTNEVITDIWLVDANANKIFQDTDFNAILNENTYTVNEISQASMQSYNDLSNTNINLNLEGFETGYYRVFIKTDQSLYWDNIYVDNDGADITEFFDSWE